MAEPACPGCRELLQRVAELEAQVADLTRKLDDALRAGTRQAAPFRKGPPRPDPKPPGRKTGDAHGTHGHRPPPPPEQIAECHDAHLPDVCPHCRDRIVETGTANQFQTEIPRKPLIRKFRVHVGHCESCGKRTQGRHPLQTSDALGAAASQIGPDAQAAESMTPLSSNDSPESGMRKNLLLAARYGTGPEPTTGRFAMSDSRVNGQLDVRPVD